MKVHVKPGKYAVAVSGGVDSMVLLDLLAGQTGLELIVAHFEHGIRADSDKDRQLVEQTAARYGLPFVCEHGRLGPRASEAMARDARYAFLRRVQAAHGADAIITAHHQDDLVETAIINLLRGTGSRGLSALASTNELVRPLLATPKAEVLAYAKARHIAWHEDSTNADERYLRNYVRKRIVTRMDSEARRQFLRHIATASEQNKELDALLDEVITVKGAGEHIARHWFIMLPHDVSCTVLAVLLRRARAQYDRKLINRLVVFAKTATVGKRADVDARHQLEAGKNYITLTSRS